MESHELRLVINAAAAKAGGRQFVAAIRQIHSAVMKLDRDSGGAFTKIKSQAAGAAASARKFGSAIKQAGNDAARATNAASGGYARQSTSARKALASQLQINAAMRSASAEAERLRARLIRAGDAGGAAQVSAAYANLSATTRNAALTQEQLRASVDRFKNTTSGMNVQLQRQQNATALLALRNRELASAEDRAAQATRRIEMNLRSAAGAANAANGAFRNAIGGVRGLENSMNLAYQASTLLRVGLGALTLGSLTGNVFEAGDALQQFSITMEVASGSAEAAANDLIFIDEMAARLGTSLTASRDAFSKFAVSSQIAGVSGSQTREIFESVSTAMAVLGRGTEDQRLAFLALEQMMSKGIISAEELRRQLGERLPGAVSLMARAVGVSVSELQDMLKAGELISAEVLPKFADELNRTFGSQLNRTFNRARSNLGRMQTAFQKLLEIVANSGFLDTLSREFRDLTTLLRSTGAEETARAIGEGMARAAEVVAGAATFIIENFDKIASAAKVLFGGLLIRQVALAGNALLAYGQQAAAAAVSMGIFGSSAARQAQAANAASAALARGGETFVQVGSSAATATQRVTGMARAMGVLGRAFSVLGGPIGILIGGLTLAPLLFRQFQDEVTEVSDAYQDAMQRMGAANFSFVDTARQVGEITAFEQLSENIIALREANNVLNELKNSSETFADTLRNLEGLSDSLSVSPVQQGAADDIQALVEELQKLPVGSAEAVDQIQKIKDAIVDLRAQGGLSEDAFAFLRAAEDSLLPFAQATITANGLMRENTEIAGEQGEEYQRLSALQDELARAMQAVITGSRDLTTFSDEVRANFVGLGDETRGVGDTLLLLGDQLSRISNTMGSGVRVNDLKFQIQNLALEFDGTQESIDQFNTKLEEVRSKATQVADDDSLPAFLREAAERVLYTADNAEELVNALTNLQDQSGATAAAQDGLASAVANASGNMAGATAQAYDYANALAVVQQAQASVSGISMDFREQARLRVQLSELEGEARAVFQDRYFGKTARAVAEIDKEINNLDASLQSLGHHDTIAPDIAGQVEQLRQERDSLIRAGREASIAIFQNVESRRSSRGGGGGGGKSEAQKAAEDEAEAYKAAKEALEGYVKEKTKQIEADTLVATGAARSTEAAEALAEAQRKGIVTTAEQAAAFLRMANAADIAAERMARLARDPAREWLNSVPTWVEAGRQIEAQVFDSLSDTIADFAMTGKFNFEDLGNSILSTVTKIMADMAVKELVGALTGGNRMGGPGAEGNTQGFGLGNILGGLFSSSPEAQAVANAGFDGSGNDHAAKVRAGIFEGAAEHANKIRIAMQQGATKAQTAVSQGGTTAATKMQSGVVTGGRVASGQIQAGSASGAAQMNTQIVAGSSTGAQIMGQGIAAGSQQGGGFFSQIFGGMFGGGGGNFLDGLFPLILGGLFAEGGISTQPVQRKAVPAAAFRNAPQFNRGTTNTSGIPAILHENEAVVPLSRGRKIPVELGGEMGRGAKVINQTFNISTPDADSFRKSQKQIAAEAAGAGQRALGQNG